MSALNQHFNFAGRVNYAAQVIANKRNPSRAFDNCFENGDEDFVATVLLRRAAKNPKIAANIFRYLNEECVRASAAKFEGVPTRKLSQMAHERAFWAVVFYFKPFWRPASAA